MDLNKITFGMVPRIISLDTIYDDFETFENFNIDKYFVTKGVIEGETDEEIIQSAYLSPPNFYTLNDEVVNSVNLFKILFRETNYYSHFKRIKS